MEVKVYIPEYLIKYLLSRQESSGGTFESHIHDCIMFTMNKEGWEPDNEHDYGCVPENYRA